MLCITWLISPKNSAPSALQGNESESFLRHLGKGQASALGSGAAPSAGAPESDDAPDASQDAMFADPKVRPSAIQLLDICTTAVRSCKRVLHQAIRAMPCILRPPGACFAVSRLSGKGYQRHGVHHKCHKCSICWTDTNLNKSVCLAVHYHDLASQGKLASGGTHKAGSSILFW